MSPDSCSIRTPAAEQAVQRLIADLGTVPHVAGATDPFADPGAISQDGQTLVAHLRLDVINPPDMPVADSQQLLDIVPEGAVGLLDGVLPGIFESFSEPDGSGRAC